MMSDISTVIDPGDLRKAFGVFATGVTVVTTVDETGEPRGFTANSFTSVSLDPPLVLICVGNHIRTAQVFRNTKSFAINILSSEQSHISAAFGTPQGKRFEETTFKTSTTGSPIIDHVSAWLDCEVYDLVEQGDHFLLIGRVVGYDYTATSPLGYCRGAYVTFDLTQQALQAVEDKQPMVIGAIVEYQDSILLLSENGALSLPSASQFGSKAEPDGLIGQISRLGVDADLSFIFAVFDDKDAGVHYIFYRGEVNEVTDQRIREQFFAFDDIPWEKISNAAVRSMLDRYIKERRQDLFGVYVGDVQSGVVKTIT